MNSLNRPKGHAATLATVKHETVEERRWLGSLTLHLEKRAEKTVLARTWHEGPLRVQRPFYPEKSDCCHVYVLHPPGGLVIGDKLEIKAKLNQKAQALLTTPSAGKIYGAKNRRATQSQRVNFQVAEDACLEWLPQETIIFDSAHAQLATRIDISASSRFFGWDIVRLGRAASGEKFTCGRCEQSLEIWQDNKPLFIEKNKIVAGSDIQSATWGLQSKNTFGTLVATVVLSREDIDNLYTKLAEYNKGLWGLTQKNQLFIARYLGDEVSHCRKGFELIWRETRIHFNNKNAVVPRIWHT